MLLDLESVKKLLPEGTVDILNVSPNGVYLIAYSVEAISLESANLVAAALTKRGITAVLVPSYISPSETFSALKLKEPS